jgi:hypothetical protein
MDPEIEEIDPEFAAAFNEGEDAPGLGAGAGDAAGAADAADGGELGDGEVAQPAGEEAAVAPAAAAPAAGPELSPEALEQQAQKLRSWEGRLRAREAEISGKAAKPAAGQDAEEASEMLEGVAGAAAVGGSEDLAQAANAAAEAVESGEMTPEQAMAQLSEDFGNEFIGMIKVLAKAFAKEEVEPVAKKADELDTKFNSTAERAHFTAIAARHPDFRDVAQSPDFKAFLDGLPDDVRADAQNVAQGGTAEEVIDLLDVFKETAGKKQAPAAAAQPSQEDTGAAVDEDLQSMEGVRSGGVRLPEKPAAPKDDFEGAWEAF